jgi:hypothetical protein
VCSPLFQRLGIDPSNHSRDNIWPWRTSSATCSRRAHREPARRPVRNHGGARTGPKTVAGTARIAAAQGARALGAVQAAAWTRPRASARRPFTHGARFQARWSVLYAIPSHRAGPAGLLIATTAATTQGKAHPFASPGSRQQRRSSP